MDGDLALINLTKPVIREEFGQDLKEGCKENLSSTFKLVALVPSSSFDYGTEALKHIRNFATIISQPHLRPTRQFKPQEV